MPTIFLSGGIIRALECLAQEQTHVKLSASGGNLWPHGNETYTLPGYWRLGRM